MQNEAAVKLDPTHRCEAEKNPTKTRKGGQMNTKNKQTNQTRDTYRKGDTWGLFKNTQTKVLWPIMTLSCNIFI